ncbi:MAG TPA: pilus assembly protein N-terminal domain-containing protein [Geomonas sp.]|nr:pilus assembly protein N-terminal domain-containing protein [Geomonas sp.]
MKPRPTAVTVLLPLLMLLLLPVLALAGVSTDVVVNHSVLLNLQHPSKRVSVASPEIAELVVISPTQVQINGKKIGSTSLIVWDKNDKTSFFDIHVTGDFEVLQNQINKAAPNDTIKVEFANDTIVLTGKVKHEYTKIRALQLANAYAAKAEGGGGSSDQPLDTSVSSYSAASSSSFDRSAGGGSKVSFKVIDQIEVEQPQQVLLEVKVAQVDKDALKSLGISLLTKGAGGEGFSNLVGAPFPNTNLNAKFSNDGINANSSGLGALNGAAGVGLDAYQLGVSVFKPGIGALLKALVTKNHAKVLAEPNLLVRSGQVGKFLAGSKIPISYVSGVGALSATSIEFIDVGVKLNFRPEVLESGMISLKIDPAEVSSIAGTLAVNGYPIIDTREVRTQVQLKEGESLILAGLLQKEAIKTMSKIPILGDIPILGALFRSIQDDTKEKELVFCITPRLAAVVPAGVKPELPTDKSLSPEQERDMKWIPTTLN